MLRIWLMVALFVTAALSGCASAPEDEEDGDDTDTGFTPGPDPGTGNETNETLAVTWLEVPEEDDGTGLRFSWQVSAEGGDNTTFADNITGANDTTEVEETGLAYGFTSVPAPSSPTDYDNVSGQVNNTTTGAFEATVNATGDGPLYVRAYALSGDTYTWSDEVEVNLTSEGVEHEVVIQDGTVPVGQFAGFDTTALTIAVGDSVVWNNTASGSHNIVITGPEEFETGSIASGARSDPIVFQTAGEYTFEFDSGSSERGTITVEG